MFGGDFINGDPGIGEIWISGIDGLEIITDDVIMVWEAEGIKDDGIIINEDREILEGAKEGSVVRFWDMGVIEINGLD